MKTFYIIIGRGHEEKTNKNRKLGLKGIHQSEQLRRIFF